MNPIETGWRAASESATAIYDACAADPACHTAFAEGRAEYTRVLNVLAANPRTVHVVDPKTGKDATVVIDAYKLSYTVQFGTLIGSAPKVPSMIHNLAVGDGTEAARRSSPESSRQISIAMGCNGASCAARWSTAPIPHAWLPRANTTSPTSPPP